MHFLIQTKSWSSAWNRLSTVSKLNQVISHRVLSGFTDPKKVSKMYERRFSIESSYRIRNTSKPRTSSKKPQVRYLYTIISFIIQNYWVCLLYTSDAADEEDSVDLGGRRIIKK